MRLPRDVSGRDLVAALARFEYAVTRQTGSHLRLTTQRNGEHHVTIPNHNPIRIGTLNAIIRDLADHHGGSRDEIITLLFG